MTMIRSANPATTPRSCVISTMPAPVTSCAVRSTSRICACTVTSSAVVGSSAMIRSGSLAIAIAIIARWRIPPENSCGNASARARGFGMPTEVEQLNGSLARRVPRHPRRWIRRASAIWSPTVKIGVSAESGSWKTIAMRRPRMDARSVSRRPISSVPRNRMEPATRACGGNSPMVASADTDLPDPDSPTIPSTSPVATSKLTPRTAATRPASLGNDTSRSRTCRTASSAVVAATGVAASTSSPSTTGPAPGRAGVERVPQTVAEEVHGEDGDDQQGRREQEEP